MSSDDPIRKAYALAIEYINDDGLISDDDVTESADGFTNLIRFRVECLYDYFDAEDGYDYFDNEDEYDYFDAEDDYDYFDD